VSGIFLYYGNAHRSVRSRCSQPYNGSTRTAVP
jgi:hypothetical protein